MTHMIHLPLIIQMLLQKRTQFNKFDENLDLIEDPRKKTTK